MLSDCKVSANLVFLASFVWWLAGLVVALVWWPGVQVCVCGV